MPYKDEEERQYRKAWRKRHKELGLCCRCNEPAIKIGWRTFYACLLHLDRDERRDEASYAKHREQRVMYYRARYYRLKSENKCVKCGRPLEEENRVGVCCVSCYDRKEGNW